VVLENLDGKFGRSKAKDTENVYNFNDKTKALQISSIKDIFIRLCRKNSISVSIVQPEYTSQMCPVCGCIHKSNRPNQSTFRCVECGYEANADENASVNIRNRVVSEKLCGKLLKRTSDGYVPLNISHDDILDRITDVSCTTPMDSSPLRE